MGFVEEANRMFPVLAFEPVRGDAFGQKLDFAKSEYLVGNPKSKSKPLPIIKTLLILLSYEILDAISLMLFLTNSSFFLFFTCSIRSSRINSMLERIQSKYAKHSSSDNS